MFVNIVGLPLKRKLMPNSEGQKKPVALIVYGKKIGYQEE